jgi:dTDP-4-dehydrorhamnose 3,5-epimerase
LIFDPTNVAGVCVIEPELVTDERGSFARLWCRREFEARGMCVEIAQQSVSISARAGTVRGLHFQIAPHAETKLIRCTAGSIYDVVVDLRPESVSYLQWVGVHLSAANRKMLYVPQGCAHGFQTLTDATEVAYSISEFYQPEAARGVRYDDPALGIAWPLPVTTISECDLNWERIDATGASHAEQFR